MKLAIISHTEHYKLPDGTIVGWGPTVSEINHLAKDFEEIYHIAFLHTNTPPLSSIAYILPNIKFVPLKPVGGKSVVSKIQVILNIPAILKTINKTLQLVDVFQLRTPTGMGVFLIPYFTFFNRKRGWYKYAGNWNQVNAPLGYSLQKWMLKHQKKLVTINGSWPKQPNHCITFENPCLTNKERKEGLIIVQNKLFEPPYTFCFVGRLEDAKGVQRIIDAFGNLGSPSKVKAIHFIGNSKKMNYYKGQCYNLNIPANFHGFLNRDDVFEIYKQSHFILLPSTASEGFPKVIAEAMNYGCLPIVSAISSIEQYVNKENGFILTTCTSMEISQLLDNLTINSEELKHKTIKAHKTVKDFTFKNYRTRIKTEIIYKKI